MVRARPVFTDAWIATGEVSRGIGPMGVTVIDWGRPLTRKPCETGAAACVVSSPG